jgi:hypothetical protein
MQLAFSDHWSYASYLLTSAARLKELARFSRVNLDGMLPNWHTGQTLDLHLVCTLKTPASPLLVILANETDDPQV